MFLGDGFYRDQAYLTLEDYINEQPPFTFDMPHNPAGLTLGTFREQSAVKTPAENWDLLSILLNLLAWLR